MAQPCLDTLRRPRVRKELRLAAHEGQAQQLAQKAKVSCFGRTEAGGMLTGVSKEKFLSYSSESHTLRTSTFTNISRTTPHGP